MIEEINDDIINYMINEYVKWGYYKDIQFSYKKDGKNVQIIFKGINNHTKQYEMFLGSIMPVWYDKEVLKLEAKKCNSVENFIYYFCYRVGMV